MTHALAGRSPGVVIIIWTKMIKRRETAIFTCAINCTKYRTHLQTLQRGQLSIHIATERATLILIVCVGHHVTVGVAIVLIPVAIVSGIIRTAIETIVVAGLSTCLGLTAIIDVRGIYRSQWRCAKCTTQGIIILVANAYTGGLSIYEAYLFAHFQQVFYDVMLRVDTEVVALVI